jgi:hypothetical protein
MMSGRRSNAPIWTRRCGVSEAQLRLTVSTLLGSSEWELLRRWEVPAVGTGQ